MEDFLIKANAALLEGDRDGALRILEGRPATVDILWLRAHCVTSDKERISLLKEIAQGEYPVYSRLAEEILDRDRKFSEQLSQPPEYQFWKKPTWQERIQQLRQQRGWILGILGTIVMSSLVISGMIISDKHDQQIAFQATQIMQATLSMPTATLRPTPTVTPIAAVGPISYPGGELSIIRFESDTDRKVVQAGSYQEDEVATPASGAVFWAFEYRFICRKAVCDNPPEVEKIILKLRGGGEREAEQFVLADFPAAERVADGVSTTGWLVFEIPERANPETFILMIDREQSVELQWKR
jgi:hypothetical protein